METLGLGLILSFRDNASQHIHGIIGLLQQFQHSLSEIGTIANTTTVRGINAVANATGLLGVAIGALGVVATGVFANMALEVTRVGMEMEGMLTALDQMIGSKPKAMSRLLDFEQVAARTPLTFKDVANMGTQLTVVGLDPMKTYEGTWKAHRKRADGRTEGTYSRTVLEALGDLVAMRPDKGVSTAIREGKEFIEGNKRPLHISYGLKVEEVLGEKLAKTVEERADQLVRMLAAANYIGGMEKAGENLQTILTNLKSDVELFISYMTLPEEAGAGGFLDYIKEPFKDLFEYMKEFTKQRNIMSTVGKSWAEGLKIVVAPAKEIIRLLSGLIKLALKFSLNHPKIVTFGIAFAGLVSQILLLGGALLVVSALFLKFRNFLTGGATMMTFFRNTVINAASGLGLFIRSILPTAAALGFLYYAFRNNLFGIQSLMDSTLNKASSFVDVLMEALTRVEVDSGKYTLSDKNYNIAEQNGWFEIIDRIVVAERYVLKFWEGFKKGAEDTQKAIDNVSKSIISLMQNLGLIDSPKGEITVGSREGFYALKGVGIPTEEKKSTVEKVAEVITNPIESGKKAYAGLQQESRELGFGGNLGIDFLKKRALYNTAVKDLGIDNEEEYRKQTGLSKDDIIKNYQQKQANMSNTEGSYNNPIMASFGHIDVSNAEGMGSSLAQLLIPLTLLIGASHALRFALSALGIVFRPLIGGVNSANSAFGFFFRTIQFGQRSPTRMGLQLTRFQLFMGRISHFIRNTSRTIFAPLRFALTSIGTFIGNRIGNIGNLFLRLGTFISNVPSKVRSLWQSFQLFRQFPNLALMLRFPNLATRLQSLRNLWQAIRPTGFRDIPALLQLAFGGLRTRITGLLSPITRLIASIRNIGTTAIQAYRAFGFWRGLQYMFLSFTPRLYSFAEGIRNIFRMIRSPQGALTVLRTIFSQLFNTIKNGLSGLLTRIPLIGRYIAYIMRTGNVLRGLRFAFLGLRAVMAANPIGLALLAIGLAVEFVINHWEEFKNTATTVWQHISETLEGAWGRIKEAFEPAIKAMGEVWDRFAEAFPEAAEFIAGVFGGLINGFSVNSNTAQAIFDALGVAIEVAFDVIVAVVEIGAKAIATAIETISNVINTVIDFIKNIASGNFRAAFGVLVDGAIKQLGILGNFISGIADAISALIDRIREVNTVHVSNEVLSAARNANAGGGNPQDTMLAIGGYVTSPTRALIGEGGNPEYVIPMNSKQRSIDLMWAALRDMGAINPVFRNFLQNSGTNIPSGRKYSLISSAPTFSGSSSSSNGGNPVFKVESSVQPAVIGNIDLMNRPRVENKEEGGYSTVRSMSFRDERDGLETLIPTVIEVAKGIWEIVDDNRAMRHYYETGQHLGKFNNVNDAVKYADDLHIQQEKVYNSPTTQSSSLVKSIIGSNKQSLPNNALPQKNGTIDYIYGKTTPVNEGKSEAVIPFSGIPDEDNNRTQTQEMKKSTPFTKVGNLPPTPPPFFSETTAEQKTPKENNPTLLDRWLGTVNDTLGRIFGHISDRVFKDKSGENKKEPVISNPTESSKEQSKEIITSNKPIQESGEIQNQSSIVNDMNYLATTDSIDMDKKSSGGVPIEEQGKGVWGNYSEKTLGLNSKITPTPSAGNSFSYNSGVIPISTFAPQQSQQQQQVTSQSTTNNENSGGNIYIQSLKIDGGGIKDLKSFAREIQKAVLSRNNPLSKNFSGAFN